MNNILYLIAYNKDLYAFHQKYGYTAKYSKNEGTWVTSKVAYLALLSENNCEIKSINEIEAKLLTNGNTPEEYFENIHRKSTPRR